MNESPTFLNRAAHWTRFTLIAAIAVVMGLILTTPRNEYPLTMSRAQANAIGAAPGYLLTSLPQGTGTQFYLVDTTKQIICVYNITGDKLRLEAARKFDTDSDIKDTSISVGKVQIEGKANGVSKDDAKIYWDEVGPKIEELLNKKPKK